MKYLDDYKQDVQTTLERFKKYKAQKKFLKPDDAEALFFDSLLDLQLDQESAIEKQLKLYVAKKEGQKSWLSLLNCLKKKGLLSKSSPPIDRRLYKLGQDETGLNLWFPTYEEAKNHLNKRGGFLFPWGKTFFICGPAHIKCIGLNPSDPDWKQIGFDWFQPKDQIAWKRLESQLPKMPSN